MKTFFNVEDLGDLKAALAEAQEVKAKNHTNKDIDTTKTHLNYYIKENELTYTKEFDKYLKETNAQGHLRSNSIIMCQMIFTSDQIFFGVC